MRRTVLVFLMLLIIITAVFSQTGSESVKQEYNLVYIPRAVANNSNVMIDLSLPLEINASNIPTLANYATTSTGNVSFCRIRDSLENVAFNNDLKLTISSSNEWKFVNENNSTVTRPFRVTAVQFTGTRQNNGTYDFGETGTVLPMTYSNGEYSLTLPLASTSSGNPSKVYDLDLCIEFEDDGVDYSKIEPGYYRTELTVKTTGGANNGLYQKKKDGTVSNSTAPLSETVVIRGHIGADPGTNFATHSFMVSDSTDTYSMDLGISEHGSDGAKMAYKVATVSFLYSEITQTELSGANNTTDKFKIIISPGPDYNVGGNYMFILQNTEHQARTDKNTIYYDLYIKTGSSDAETSYSKMSSSLSSTTVAGGTVGSWGYSTTGQHVYYLKPKYNHRQVAEAGSTTYLWIFDQTVGTDLFENTWTLDQDIWLKIDQTSLENYLQHNNGLYWSYLYFTLVTT